MRPAGTRGGQEVCQDSLIDVETLFSSTTARAGVAWSLFLALFLLTRRGGLSKGLSLPACRRGSVDGQPALDSFPSTSCLIPLPLLADTIGKLMNFLRPPQHESRADRV